LTTPVVIIAGDKRPIFLTESTTTYGIVEVELAATARVPSACADGDGEEKKVGEYEVKVYLQIW
jgi:hypothetical protein